MPQIFLVYSRSLSLTPFKPQAFEILVKIQHLFQKTLAPEGLKQQVKLTIITK